MTPAAAFGTVLRRLRLARGLTQEDLAFASGVDRAFIAKMEGGRRQPTITTLLRLSRALGVPAAEVVAGLESELEGDPQTEAPPAPDQR